MITRLFAPPPRSALLPSRSRVGATSPRVPLAIAMSVAFGSLAALVCHVTNVAAIDRGQLVITVLLASAAGAPTTYLAAAVRGTSRDGIPSTKPFFVTIVSGALLGAASQTYVALRLAAWEQLWLCGIPLGQNRAIWIMMGALLGALAGVGAYVAIAIGLRALEALPPVLDAEEKLGVPALATATLAATFVLAILDAEELVPASAVAGLGLAGLVVLARRDAARRSFVTRVFAGTEPGVEILSQASDAERGSLARVCDIPYGDRVLVERTEQTYRTTARGSAIMLLAETREETLAPIVSRQRVATFAAIGCIVLFGLRIASLEIFHH